MSSLGSGKVSRATLVSDDQRLPGFECRVVVAIMCQVMTSTLLKWLAGSVDRGLLEVGAAGVPDVLLLGKK